jgi:hypothetical protein
LIGFLPDSRFVGQAEPLEVEIIDALVVGTGGVEFETRDGNRRLEDRLAGEEPERDTAVVGLDAARRLYELPATTKLLANPPLRSVTRTPSNSTA